MYLCINHVKGPAPSGLRTAVLSRSRQASGRAVTNTALLEEIREIYRNSRRTYWAPRVRGKLRRDGRCVDRHRIPRLMRTGGAAAS